MRHFSILVGTRQARDVDLVDSMTNTEMAISSGLSFGDPSELPRQVMQTRTPSPLPLSSSHPPELSRRRTFTTPLFSSSPRQDEEAEVSWSSAGGL